MAINVVDPYTYLLGDAAVKEKRTRLRRKEILNPRNNEVLTSTQRSPPRYVPAPAPSAQVICCHVSVISAFLDQIAFPTFLQKNWRHPRAVEQEVMPFSPRILNLDVGKGLCRPRGNTKIWVVVLVCKGTTICTPTSRHGSTSPRRFCGYGLRLFSYYSEPEKVIVEEFGAHTDERDDDGWKFQPPVDERVVLTPTMVMDAFRSFDRSIKPAKHLQLIAENRALLDSSVTNPTCQNDLLHAIQLCHRRYNYLIQSKSDEEGTMEISKHLQESRVFLFDFQHLRNSPQHWVLFISHYEVASMAIEFGGDIVGLDATHNVTCYKNTYLFAIMGRSSSGAIPLGYFISTLKDEEAVTVGLTVFKFQISECLHQCNKMSGEELFCPKAICIDMDSASNNAVRTVFPTSVLVLCHYHFMVNMINQARNGSHGLSKDGISGLMTSLRTLSNARTVENFRLALVTVKTLSSSFYQYLDDNYLNEAWIDTFSEVNRTHLPLAVQRLCRSNMLTEVSFRTFKYIILGGVMNKRLDMLIYSVAYRMFPYFLNRIRVSAPKPSRFLISLDTREKGTQMFR